MVRLYATQQFPLDIYTFSDSAATTLCVTCFITVQCFEFGGLQLPLHLYYITSGKTSCTFISHFLLAAKIVAAEHEYSLPISLCSVFKDVTKL